MRAIRCRVPRARISNPQMQAPSGGRDLWLCRRNGEERGPAKKAAGEAGDPWLWLATDADVDTRLVPCWHVGTSDGEVAMEFIDDLASRLARRAAEDGRSQGLPV